MADLRYAGFKMACDLNEMLQRQFYFFGTYYLEADVLECWQEAAVGARVVFDVGANAGIFSLAALAASPLAVVHAFEPTPEIAARLRHTAKLNDLSGLCVHEVGISARNGSAALRRFRGETNSNEGMNYLTESGEAGDERVPTVSIDAFCDDHAIDRIDLLKIDIQGNEYAALAGAAAMIGAGRIGTLFTELNWAAEGDPACSATQSIMFLEGAGYRFARPGPGLDWKESGDWMRVCDNIVARYMPRSGSA